MTGSTERIEHLVARAAAFYAAARGPAVPLLDDDAALREEARRLRPHLEALVGRPYGRLPWISYRRGLEARLAGPWSQYLTLGLGATRLVRMTGLPSARPAIPTILAHELAHRYGFDESVTTLRGLEISARLAEAGDPSHARAVRLELGRLHLAAAMAEALANRRSEPVDRFLAGAAGAELERPRRQWMALRGRSARRPDWTTLVYAALPLRALEAAAARGEERTGAIPFPRFPLDSAPALAAFLYTGADAISGRRRAAVPVGATLRLLARDPSV